MHLRMDVQKSTSDCEDKRQWRVLWKLDEFHFVNRIVVYGTPYTRPETYKRLIVKIRDSVMDYTRYVFWKLVVHFINRIVI